ncbi:MAG: hypothetical protein NTZ07_01090 [Candidatus Woesebacteria bacterium]|nr:hypothetical protein [Candidatus Woesebacteria bacterium]
MSERLVCVQLIRLDGSEALLKEKYVGQDGKYTSVPEDAGTVDEMIEKARKILAASPKNVSFGVVDVKKLKEYRLEHLQGAPEN